jgi:putative acetyltransferase
MARATTEIVRFRPEFAADFDRLNREWLERDFTVEPLDEACLADPEGWILARGGEIFFAVRGGLAVGTCAAIPHGEDEFELAKLCVTPKAQGKGLGRALAGAVLGHARRRGARRVVLVSSSRLGPALRLYESLGFEQRPFSGAPRYVDADVYMELELERVT